MTLPGATLASGAIGTAGGIIGSILNYKSQKQTNQANLDLAKMQNDWNVEQWNRENEYNSPSNQVKLLQDAGLNPNLYQANNSTAPNLESSDLANQQAPQIDVNTPLQTGLIALQQAAQAEELRAQIKESYQRQRFAEGFFPYQMQALDLQNGLLGDQRSIAFWQRELARQQYVQGKMSFPAQLANTRAATEATYAGINKTQSDIAVNRQNIDESQNRIAQAWKDLEIKTHLSDWQIRQMKADIAGINANTNLALFRLNMTKKYHIDPNLPALNNLITLALADPSQFSNVAGTLRTNLHSLFDHGKSTAFSIGDAFRRTLTTSHNNPFFTGRGF